MVEWCKATRGAEEEPLAASRNSDPTDRRQSPRAAYTDSAIVYLGNEQLTCHVADLSKTGLLIFPPVQRGVGTFLRLNISLPGLDKVLDVDAFVMREGEKDGYYVWGVQLHELSPRAEALINTYVEWERKRTSEGEEPAQDLAAEAPQEETPAADRSPVAELVPVVDQAPGGPKQTETITAKFRAAAAKQRQEVDERWQERQAREKADKELRDLYTDALKNL